MVVVLRVAVVVDLGDATGGAPVVVVVLLVFFLSSIEDERNHLDCARVSRCSYCFTWF